MNARRQYKRCLENLIGKQLRFDYLPEESRNGRVGKNMKEEMFVLEGMLKIYKKLEKMQRDERG